ncbi:MAG: hypothetical protein N3A65_09515 [candidate division WOR-3 bacterium]|nr:hypothetical protein [candidate division WOR-3 bacterium]
MDSGKNLRVFAINVFISLLVLYAVCHRDEKIKFWDDISPIWSPKSQYIAFNRIYRLLFTYDTILQDTLSGLRILDLASLGVVDSLISNFCVDWSPNGDEILILDGRLYNVKTHTVRYVFDTSLHYYASDWSPNGTRILCVKKNLSMDSFMILMVDTLATYSKVLFNSGCAPSWHPSGDRVIFLGTVNDEVSICIGDTNGNIMRYINVDGDLIPFGGRGPRFSPDGSRIVYFVYELKNGGLDDYYIHICDSLGGNDKKLIDGFHPFWSPDGKRIVFARYNGEDSLYSSIWVIDTSGGNLRRITD